MYNMVNTDVICPNCGEGHMIRKDPIIIKSNTKTFDYICPDCGFIHTAKSDEDMKEWIKSLDKLIEEKEIVYELDGIYYKPKSKEELDEQTNRDTKLIPSANRPNTTAIESACNLIEEKTMLYIVHFDGLLDGYGTENYLLGIYSTREKANEAVEEFEELLKENSINIEEYESPRIDGVILDHTYKVDIDPKYVVSTQVYLGGFLE